MEHDAVKLADLLSLSCKVVLICKKNSFIERLYNKRSYSFDVETVDFINKNISISMLLLTRNILHQYEIRNVIFFGASELKVLYFSFIGKNLNVIVRHGTTKSRHKRGAFHRLIYSCVTYHVAISRHLLANVRKIVPYKENVRFEIIYPSFTFRESQNSINTGDRKLNIIHIGRIVEGKGHKDAVYACKALYDSGIDFQLLFVGNEESESYSKEVHKIVEDMPYKEKVTFIGYVDNVWDYLNAADMFLYPSYGEGFGNVFVEAMAHGLSAVTYENTTFPEFMEMGFKFRMAKNRNIESLSEELLQAAENLQKDRIGYKSNIRLAADIFSGERELKDWSAILV